MRTYHEQEISNHPLFPNIKRKLVVFGFPLDARYDQFIIPAEIHYFDENQENKDVTAAFKSQIDNWIISNNDTTTVRDSLGKPVPNPKFREAPSEGEDDRSEEEKEFYLKRPSYDYFLELSKDPTKPHPIKLLSMHIKCNDEIGFFDELLNIKT